jgi:hypothetical protein
VELLEAGIASAKASGSTDEALAKIVALRDDMKRPLTD